MIRLGDQEVRLNCEPFALYPGESLSEGPTKLQVLEANHALRVRAVRDFKDDGVQRTAGDEWMIQGPCTYVPHTCKQVLATVPAHYVNINEALKLTAVNTFTDSEGVVRKVGTEWLWKKFGPFLPSADEKVVEVVKAKILTETKGLHISCTNSFTDVFGTERCPGDVWLVTHKDTTAYLPTPNETVVGEVSLLVLDKKQYCIVTDPFDAAKKQVLMGMKKLIRGPDRFFLHPGEKLFHGCAKDVPVLMADEAVLLEALEDHKDASGTDRSAGDFWMVHGPCEFVPPVSVEVRETRRAIPLHDFEGVYVRDLKTGEVRSQMGPCSYMLQPEEELWAKELPVETEKLLHGQNSRDPTDVHSSTARDKTKVVTYSVPHNSVVQIFDYKIKKSRAVTGPDMLSLNPDEEFTVVCLSGGKPKKPNVIKSLSLFLGPDFMTDNIRVETADHARLELQLSYNWRFDVDPTKAEDARKVFSVHDFVGDSCKAIASRIRGNCAGVTFDNLHKNSSMIIRHAVFGSYGTFLSNGVPVEVGTVVVNKATNEQSTVTSVVNKDGTTTVKTDGAEFTDADAFAVLLGAEQQPVVAGKWPNSALRFPTNGLVVSNVDIQSVEPVDQKTKDSLLKSVQLAIHITTQGQEAQAKHKATEEEQKARGELESQMIRDKAAAERERKELLQLKAESQSIESTGSQRAEATATAEAAAVEAQCMVSIAEKRAAAQEIQVRTELEMEVEKNQEAVEYQNTLNTLEVGKAKEMATIETEKFSKAVTSMGKETIEAIAAAGPENQVRLLKALNLQGYMVTDGSSPINLFNAAQGMTGGANAAA